MFKKGDKVYCADLSKNKGPIDVNVHEGKTYTVEKTYVNDYFNTDELQLYECNAYSVTADCFSLVTPTPEAPTVTEPTAALRFDSSKSRAELLCPIAMQGCADVLTFGAKKYAEHNWQKGMKWGRVIGSLLRHTFKFISGEDVDSESGLPHVDHILCNAMFLSNYYRTHKSLDDRYKKESI